MASIRRSDDRLRAILRVDGGELLQLPDLRRLLQEAGIHAGVQREVLVAAMAPAGSPRELVIAECPAPPTGPLIPLRLLDGLFLPLEVEAGMAVATCDPRVAVPTFVGVDGQPLIVSTPHPGVGLAVDDDGRITARWAGTLVADEHGCWRVDLPGGVRVVCVAHPSISVAADGLSASIALGAGEFVLAAGLREALAAAGVVHGLDRDALIAAGAPATEARTLVIARGDAPEDGGDDGVLHLIRVESPLAVDRHDHIDFHRQRWLREVLVGTELVRLLRGRPAHPGRSVTGAVLPARAGAVVDLARLAGNGTAVRATDPPQIVASQAGAYACDGAGIVSVSCPVVIPGHLDHHTGDVDTHLPVDVRGDVVAGFTLLVAAPVTVAGGIEDARVVVTGDLTVGGGVLPGRQRVVVHGRLTARHVTGRPVQAMAVSVATSIIDSELVVVGDLTCGTLISSRIIAGGTVTCEVCGDPNEARTEIELGGNARLSEQSHEAEAVQRQQGAEAEHLRERLHVLQHRLHELLEHDGVDEAGPIAEEIADDEHRLAVAERLLERAKRIIALHRADARAGSEHFANARLVVKRRVHAGTSVSIGGQRMQIDTTIEGSSTFHLVDGVLTRE